MAETPVTSTFLKSVPHSSGVYLMKDAGGRILYVGKARDLRQRLASYRGAEARKFSKTAVMLKKAASVETILTATEKEALILEASLIKKHKPRYNIILRDDKNYPYIKVTVNESWPRVVVSHRRRKDGARYFGPYSAPSAMRETLTLVRELFPLRTCKGTSLKKRPRPCLNHQMGKCLAPCCGLADRAEYLENVDNIIRVLEGHRRELAGWLEKKMRSAAAAQEFEKAAHFRDRLSSLNKTLEKQVIAAGHHRDQDIFGLVRQGLAAAVSVVFVRDGLVSGQQSYFFESPLGDEVEILGECLGQFYGEERYVPTEILLSHKLFNYELLEEWLAEQRGAMVRLKRPQRGNPAELVQMAIRNAEQVFADEDKKERSRRALLKAVAGALKLSGLPQTVECLDISNIGGKQAVGSLVCFKDGEPFKKGYRHYRIRGGDTPDDYGMIREVLIRRLEPGKAGEMPDLLLIDGGKGQLNIAVEVLRESGREGEIELAALAKEKEDEGEKLFRPGRKNPLKLPAHSPVLLFLMKVRDESHRFGITFHRRLRRKDTLKSELDKVSGVGPARRRILLKTFGSIKRIKAATLEELAATDGIGPELAQVIFDGLK